MTNCTTAEAAIRPQEAQARLPHRRDYARDPGDLEAACTFYKAFGFNQALWAPRIHMGDVCGGGLFNHRIAVNTWQGVNAPQSQACTARMRNFTLQLDTPERLDQVLGTLSHDVTEAGNGFILRDPSQDTVLLTPNSPAWRSDAFPG